MAESAKATIDLFGKHIVYLNVLRRMSVDCDCVGLIAAEPTIPDIGILASTDLLAIDQASVDLVYQTASNQDLVKRIESRHGLHQLQAMKELKMGNPQYELIEVNDKGSAGSIGPRGSKGLVRRIIIRSAAEF